VRWCQIRPAQWGFAFFSCGFIIRITFWSFLFLEKYIIDNTDGLKRPRQAADTTNSGTFSSNKASRFFNGTVELQY
jgi:hypothetical protein